MDPISASVASGMRARFESLDLLANNLANAGTRGFKADRELYSSYASEEAQSMSGLTPAMPVIQRAWTDHTQGLLQPTENPLDIALQGKGFLSVNGPSGTLYTRHGGLQLSPKGQLQTTDGYPVRSVGGRPIQLRANLPFEIDTGGRIKQEGEEVGRLGITTFDNPDTLVKHGLSYFSAAESTKISSAPSDTKVRQGQIEASNVAPAESAVRLVGVLRQFEALQKALIITNDMNRKVVEEVAKTTA